MKFITTTVAALAVVTTLGWLLFGGELGSVVETSLSRTRTGMGSNLSHEFRADQAELQVRDLRSEALPHRAKRPA